MDLKENTINVRQNKFLWSLGRQHGFSFENTNSSSKESSQSSDSEDTNTPLAFKESNSIPIISLNSNQNSFKESNNSIEIYSKNLKENPSDANSLFSWAISLVKMSNDIIQQHRNLQSGQNVQNNKISIKLNKIKG